MAVQEALSGHPGVPTHGTTSWDLKWVKDHRGPKISFFYSNGLKEMPFSTARRNQENPAAGQDWEACGTFLFFKKKGIPYEAFND